MSKYYCFCRSNYFKIGQPKKFLEWVKSIPCLAFSSKEKQTEDPKDLVGMIYIDCIDTGGWPTYRCIKHKEDGEEFFDEVDIDFYQELSEFLAPGEVAILMESGAEDLRHLVGNAYAINSDGDFLEVNINDIYDKVHREWGIKNISTTEY